MITVNIYNLQRSFGKIHGLEIGHTKETSGILRKEKDHICHNFVSDVIVAKEIIFHKTGTYKIGGNFWWSSWDRPNYNNRRKIQNCWKYDNKNDDRPPWCHGGHITLWVRRVESPFQNHIIVFIWNECVTRRYVYARISPYYLEYSMWQRNVSKWHSWKASIYMKRIFVMTVDLDWMII